MTDFKGSNKLQSSFALFFYRKKWINEAYEKFGVTPKQSKFFSFSEESLHGLIDHNKKPIQALPDTLEAFPYDMSNDELKLVLPFFKQQIMDLRKYLGNSKLLNLPINNRWINNLTIYEAWTDPETEYKKWATNLVVDFINNGINGKDDIGKRFHSYSITRFDHFVNNFVNFLELKWEKNPILFSDWMLSTQSPLACSGMRVKVSDQEYSTDQWKWNELVNTPEFDCYITTMKEIGLAFDFNDPSVIVPDLESPAIKKYLDNYEIGEYTNIFNIHYTNTIYNKDIILLYNILIYQYNIYINNQSYVAKFEYTCNSVNPKFIQMQGYQESDLNKIDEIKLYIKLKSITQPGILQKDLKGLEKNSKFLQKVLDKSSALSYINDIFLSKFFNSPYSVNDLYRRKLKSQQEKENQQLNNTFGGTGDISSY